MKKKTKKIIKIENENWWVEINHSEYIEVQNWKKEYENE